MQLQNTNYLQRSTRDIEGIICINIDIYIKIYNYIFIQFNVPFKIISAHMGQKREDHEKNHLAHPQAELGSNPL